MAIKGYLSHGKDGYDMLMGRRVLAEAESLPQLATLIKGHFDAMSHVNAKQDTGDAEDVNLSVAVKQHIELCQDNIHVSRDNGQPLSVCAQVDGRIQCLALVNN